MLIYEAKKQYGWYLNGSIFWPYSMQQHVIFSLLFLLFFHISVWSQDASIHFDFINADHGLTPLRITEILQDRSGSLWFGGFDGLSCYNGFEFKAYHQPQSKGAFQGGIVWSMAEDLEGRLWVGTRQNGMSFTNTSKNYFYELHHILDDTLRELSMLISDVLVDRKNRIWVAGNQGLQVFGMEQNEVKFSSLNTFIDSIPFGKGILIRNMFLGQANNLWVGTNKGVFVANIDSLKWYRAGQLGLVRDPIDDIRMDVDGNIWVARKSDESRLLMYAGGSLLQPTPLTAIETNNPNSRLHFNIDRKNRIWAAAFGEQVFGYRINDSVLFMQSHMNSNISVERFIRRPFPDSDGNVWIPGYQLFKYNSNVGFHSILPPDQFDQFIHGFLIEDENNYLAIREQGFVKGKKQSSPVEQFNTKAHGFYNLPTNYITSFLRLSDGKLAVLGFPWLILLDEEKRKQNRIRLPGSSRGMLESRDNYIWLGGFRGLEQYDLTGSLINRYSFQTNEPEKTRLLSVEEDERGDIWFGTNGSGMGKLERLHGRILNYSTSKIPAVPRYIYDLIHVNDSTLWMATDQGLCLFNEQDSTISTYGLEHGFINTNIAAISMDHTGRIWCATSNGISRFDPRAKQATCYTKSDGLLNNDYSIGERQKKDNNLFFCGRKGIDFFNPDKIDPPITHLETKLFNFSANLVSLKVDSILSINNRVPLHYTDDIIDLEFGATAFTSEEHVEYQYLVSGLSDTWVSNGEQRKLTFHDLAPGDYEIGIRARKRGRQWSKHILQVPFSISTPFWQKPLVQFLGALVLCCGIFWVIKQREQRISKKHKEKSNIREEMLRLEKKALLAQMNPHFIFNSMSAIQYFIAQKNTKLAHTYLAQFGQLLRLVLRNSNNELVTLSNEFELIEQFLAVEQIRYPTSLHFEINPDSNLIDQQIKIPPFLIQPHVERAVQRQVLTPSNDGKVAISIQRELEKINVYIDEIGSTALSNEKYSDQSIDNISSITIAKKRLEIINRQIGKQHVSEMPIIQQGRQVGIRTKISINI